MQNLKTMLATGLLALSAAMTSAQAGTVVLDPGQAPAGHTLNQLAAKWWQTVYSTPASTNPVSDPTGAFGGVGNQGDVFFLYGANSGTVNRTITVRPNQYLFFPIQNFVIDNIGFQRDMTEAEQKAIVSHEADSVTGQFATVDGVAIANVNSYRADSGTQFDVTFPADNLFGYPASPNNSKAFTDGYWLVVKPLSHGQHKITFGGSFATDVTLPAGVTGADPVTFPVSGGIDATYTITATAVPLPPAVWMSLPVFVLLGVATWRERAKRAAM